MTDGFNDADIESVVNESVEECFLSGERIVQKCLGRYCLSDNKHLEILQATD